MPRCFSSNDDRRRETGQVVDVRDVGPELVDEVGGQRGDRWVVVRLLERARLAKRVVDPANAQAVAVLVAHAVLGRSRPCSRVSTATSSPYVIAQPRRERVTVRLRSALRERRKAVHDQKDAHHTPAGRQCGPAARGRQSAEVLTERPGDCQRLPADVASKVAGSGSVAQPPPMGESRCWRLPRARWRNDGIVRTPNRRCSC